MQDGLLHRRQVALRNCSVKDLAGDWMNHLTICLSQLIMGQTSTNQINSRRQLPEEEPVGKSTSYQTNLQIILKCIVLISTVAEVLRFFCCVSNLWLRKLIKLILFKQYATVTATSILWRGQYNFCWCAPLLISKIQFNFTQEPIQISILQTPALIHMWRCFSANKIRSIVSLLHNTIPT